MNDSDHDSGEMRPRQRARDRSRIRESLDRAEGSGKARTAPGCLRALALYAMSTYAYWPIFAVIAAIATRDLSISSRVTFVHGSMSVITLVVLAPITVPFYFLVVFMGAPSSTAPGTGVGVAVSLGCLALAVLAAYGMFRLVRQIRTRRR